jgi:hypothetical protein
MKKKKNNDLDDLQPKKVPKNKNSTLILSVEEFSIALEMLLPLEGN